jgi:glyoxylase-like metal-dependent hydrolase (beta-lactamase superfamily II)
MIEIDANIVVETEHLGSNNSIVSTPEGLVLIDSPHRPTDAIRWRHQVESRGETLFLINTDHHPDHTIGNYWLPGRVVSHEGTRERLTNNAPSDQYLHDLMTVIDPEGLRFMQDYRVRRPEITFSENLTLHVGGLDFEMSYARGHTLNSAIIYIPQQQICFTGDLVCNLGLPAFIEADTFAWIETIRRIEKMDIRHIVPGHGKVCDRAQATRFREMIEELVGEVERELDKGAPRTRIADLVAYEDLIHMSTGGSPDYPQHLISLFMRGSIETIFDHILERRKSLAA